MAEPRVIEIYGLRAVYKADIICFRSLVYFLDDAHAEYLVADLVAHLVDLGVGLIEFSCDHHTSIAQSISASISIELSLVVSMETI